MGNNKWLAFVDTKRLDTTGIGHLIRGNEHYECYSGVMDLEEGFQQVPGRVSKGLLVKYAPASEELLVLYPEPSAGKGCCIPFHIVRASKS